jgi:hypothetical protein
MLLELPNTEVRIYKGERRFHAKLYIFESGNQVSTAIGSFNATLGGSGRNIEAGVRSKDREIYKEAKYFFDKYWDSEETEIAQYDKNALFIQKKFQPGDSVVIRSTQEHGVILNEEPALVNKEWEYCVFINGFRRSITESQLSHLEIATYWTEKEFLSAQKGDYTFREWIRNYVLEKALDLTDRTLASLQSSRTEIYHYQFRPLFKILQSRYHRLLIADEVGLGKTIEAGIIIKELQSRIDLQRILIVVPNSLKTKWRDELAARFDEYYDILSANKMHDFLDDYVKSTSSAAVKGIISYDQLVTRSIRDKL